MSIRFRFAALAPAFLGSALLAILPARAADTYLVEGLPFFAPYRVAIATLDVADGKVSGALAAPAGDPRPSLPVTGSLSGGRLNLTLGTGAEAPTLAFVEAGHDGYVVWAEATPVAGLEEVMLFRPEAGFSAAALGVQHGEEDWCGRFVGGLSVTLRADALKTASKAPAGLAELSVVLAPRADGAVATVADLWPRLRLAAASGEDVLFDVIVPVGGEAKQAEAVRRLPLVAAVNLPATCGEMALATIPRTAIMEGDAVSEARLKAFADAVLARFLSGGEPDAATPGRRKFKLSGAQVARGPDGVIHYSARLVGDAEATRLGAGQADAFTLTLTPVVTAADTAQTVSLLPAITDLKSAKRAGGNMPADSAFQPVEDEDAPAAIAHRLVSWLAAAEGTHCAFLTQTGFQELENGLSCSNAILDGLGGEDEGGD